MRQLVRRTFIGENDDIEVDVENISKQNHPQTFALVRLLFEVNKKTRKQMVK